MIPVYHQDYVTKTATNELIKRIRDDLIRRAPSSASWWHLPPGTGADTGDTTDTLDTVSRSCSLPLQHSLNFRWSDLASVRQCPGVSPMCHWCDHDRGTWESCCDMRCDGPMVLHQSLLNSSIVNILHIIRHHPHISKSLRQFNINQNIRYYQVNQ